MEKFFNRNEAGKVLAEKLKEYANRSDTIVLALPRGGVPVAYQIAVALSAPLDVFIVRKLGAPGHEELAMGAIATGGTVVFNSEVIRELHITKPMIDDVIQAEQAELKRRELSYRGHHPQPILTDKTIILVDDGIATGATMRAAIQALKHHQPFNIVVAVPVAAKTTSEEMEKLADKVICLLKPENFYAVGQWYEDFAQTTDKEVHQLLEKARQLS